MSDREGDGERRSDPHGDDIPEFRRVRSAPAPPAPSSTGPFASDRAPRALFLPSARVRRKRLALLLAGTMSIVVLLASGTAWALSGWASGQVNRFDVFGGLLDGDRPDAGPKGALNFLVIGSDGRGDMEQGDQEGLGVGHTPGKRSDTMMLVHLNNDRDQITVVGIPRDSWVDIPGHGKDKINAAYSYGGPRLAVQTVESATHVRIDHYVEVNFTGFVDVVDALGGIEVCLPEPIDDPKAKLSMDAGTHQVDGTEALAFARTRKTPGGDLDRIDRQQQVLAALLDKALSSDTLSDPQKFTGFLDSALGSLTVDKGLDTRKFTELGSQLRTISLDDLVLTTVPVADTNYWTPRGDVAVRWDQEAAARIFGRIAADKPVDEETGQKPEDAKETTVRPEDVRLQVFNGTATPGLGAQARTELIGAGFQVPAQAQNWQDTGVAESRIRYAPDNKDTADLVSAAVPGSTLEEDAALGEEVQVVVGAGYTAVEPPASADPSPSSAADGHGDTAAATARDSVCGD